MFRKGIRNIEEEGARTECDKWTCTLGKEEQVIIFLVLRSLNSSRYLGIIFLFIHFFIHLFVIVYGVIWCPEFPRIFCSFRLVHFLNE